MNGSIHPFTLLLILLVMATACVPDEIESTAVVYQNFRDRIAQLAENLRADCQEDVIEEALKLADSLLIDRAQRMRRIEGRPPRPNRPGVPPEQQLSEPLPLRPLFPFEIRFDTLLRDSLLLDSMRMDSFDRGLLLLPEEGL